MYYDRYDFDHIAPEHLDQYLERGWFRMGGHLHTVHIMVKEGEAMNAIWLRYRLSDWKAGTTCEKLIKRNRRFTVSVSPFCLSDEQEALYLKYRLHRFEEMMLSLKEIISDDDGRNPFHSMAVNCHDGEKLIGAAIFDLGGHSAQGIVSFYDPDYKTYSLGKFLIYQQVLFCAKAGLQFFYPGYMVPGYSRFDYKMDIGGKATEFYQLSTGCWRPMMAYSMKEWHLERMVAMLQQLLPLLSGTHLTGRLTVYGLWAYEAEWEQKKTWQYLVFLHAGKENLQGTQWFIAWDIPDNHYRVYAPQQLEPEFFSEHPNGFFYTGYPAREFGDFRAFDTPEAVADYILQAAC